MRALEEAKDLAFAQARRTLKMHAHHLIKSMEDQTEKILDELWQMHCEDMEELTALIESDEECGEEEVLLKACALRSIVRFVPRQTDPQVKPRHQGVMT